MISIMAEDSVYHVWQRPDLRGEGDFEIVLEGNTSVKSNMGYFTNGYISGSGLFWVTVSEDSIGVRQQ
ncbi:hypothetical protein [Echinicola strongylocentroti]|nr:hypothetical protein [Echinicola strongylocentroti]